LANLRLLGSFDGDGALDRIEQALETVELSDRAGDRVGGYSHGMGQRLGIAAALIRNPRLLILDEPATGLDPAGMRDMRLLIRRLAASGITVLPFKPPATRRYRKSAIESRSSARGGSSTRAPSLTCASARGTAMP